MVAAPYLRQRSYTKRISIQAGDQRARIRGRGRGIRERKEREGESKERGEGSARGSADLCLIVNHFFLDPYQPLIIRLRDSTGAQRSGRAATHRAIRSLGARAAAVARHAGRLDTRTSTLLMAWIFFFRWSIVSLGSPGARERTRALTLSAQGSQGDWQLSVRAVCAQRAREPDAQRQQESVQRRAGAPAATHSAGRWSAAAA